jgi:hypothetical protein
MRRSKIYLENKFSDKELELLKADLIEHACNEVGKIKKLPFTLADVGKVVKNVVERVLITSKFGSGVSLGMLVRAQVMADLRAEMSKRYPDMASKILWPDLIENKPFEKLEEMLKKIAKLKRSLIAEIFCETNELINGRQQKILAAVYKNPALTYVDVCKQFGTRGVMTYREIKIIYSQLSQALTFLEITL